jgi:hypothetical protein
MNITAITIKCHTLFNSNNYIIFKRATAQLNPHKWQFYKIIIAAIILLFTGIYFNFVSAEELPLTVSTPSATPGQTITVNGKGFQEGARALVWGGGPFVVGRVKTFGDAQDITVAGNFAYIADGSVGSGLTIIDITQPHSPTVFSHTSVSAHRLAISGTFAYITDGRRSLTIIDISNPRLPVVIDTITTQGRAEDIAVSGNFAYVTGGYLTVIDISNPKLPVVVSSTYLLGGSLAIDISGNFAYVAMKTRGLRIIDVSLPQAPVIIGNADIPGSALDVSVDGNFAYVAGGNGLYIIDITLSRLPVLVGNIETHGLFSRVNIVGNFAYVAASLGFVVIDVSDVQAPVVVGSVVTSDRTQSISIQENFAYVVDLFNGLYVIDITHYQSPPIIGSSDNNVVDLNANIDDRKVSINVAILDDFAYLAVKNIGVQVIDIIDHQAPKAIGSTETLDHVNDIGRINNMAVADDFAYLTKGGFGLEVIDFTNPRSPTVVGHADTPGNARDVTIAGNFAYVADGYSGLTLIDISDPQSPLVISSTKTSPFNHFAHAVAIAGNFAYIAGASGLTVMDISHSLPVVISSTSTPGGNAREIAISGKYAYVVTDGGDLHVIDITNSQSPMLVGRTHSSFSSSSFLFDPYYVSISNGYVYVSDGYRGLQVIDISNPQLPTVISRTDTSGFFNGLATAGNFVYVAANHRLSILPSALSSNTIFSSSTTLEVVLPPHLPDGTYDITVLNPDGTLYKSHNAITIVLDSDSDGILDSYEDNNGLNKKDPNDTQDDLDNDGLTNKEEFLLGTKANISDTDEDGLTDYQEAMFDTDEDGLTDYQEVVEYGTKPDNEDSDADDVDDKEEVDRGMNPTDSCDGHPVEPYGTTVITHGFLLFKNGDSLEDAAKWTISMAKAIAERAGNATIYVFEEGKYSKLGGDYGSGVGPCARKGEVILVFDWLDESDRPISGYAEAAGDSLFANLTMVEYIERMLKSNGNGRYPDYILLAIVEVQSSTAKQFKE